MGKTCEAERAGKSNNKIFLIMKSFFFKLMLFCSMLICFSCSTTKKISNSHPDASTFIGNWIGENRVDGNLTTWVQKRFADGTYAILFIEIKKDEVVRNIETGKWWIENGKFYEISQKVMKTPDVYEYVIKSKDEIFFKSTSVDYQFTDRRIEENHFDKLKIQ